MCPHSRINLHGTSISAVAYRQTLGKALVCHSTQDLHPKPTWIHEFIVNVRKDTCHLKPQTLKGSRQNASALSSLMMHFSSCRTNRDFFFSPVFLSIVQITIWKYTVNIRRPHNTKIMDLLAQIEVDFRRTGQFEGILCTNFLKNSRFLSKIPSQCSLSIYRRQGGQVIAFLYNVMK